MKYLRSFCDGWKSDVVTEAVRKAPFERSRSMSTGTTRLGGSIVAIATRRATKSAHGAIAIAKSRFSRAVSRARALGVSPAREPGRARSGVPSGSGVAAMCGFVSWIGRDHITTERFTVLEIPALNAGNDPTSPTDDLAKPEIEQVKQRRGKKNRAGDEEPGMKGREKDEL